ncbi:MAG: hypothetical protein C0407_15050 [Desulfobacca sp.]|nr:hypothetical protein [Desulfobacca sp.]
MLIINKIFFPLWIFGMTLCPIGAEAFSSPGGLDSWAEKLNLTSEQAQTLSDLQGQFRQELTQIRKKIMPKLMEFRTLSSEEVKGEKGNEFRRQIQSLMLQARERSLVYQKEALAVLTPEQRKKFPAESDLGFHCRGWFRRGGGPGMGTGKGRPGPAPSQELWINQP